MNNRKIKKWRRVFRKRVKQFGKDKIPDILTGWPNPVVPWNNPYKKSWRAYKIFMEKQQGTIVR